MLILISLGEKKGRHIKHGQEFFLAPKPISLDSIASYRLHSPSGSCKHVQTTPVSDFLLGKAAMQLTMNATRLQDAYTTCCHVYRQVRGHFNGEVMT